MRSPFGGSSLGDLLAGVGIFVCGFSSTIPGVVVFKLISISVLFGGIVSLNESNLPTFVAPVGRNARYKDEFYEDCDRSTFKDQVEDVKSQSKTRSHANVPPAFRPTGATNVGRFDSFRETIPPNSTDMEMSFNTTAPGIVEEKPQTNIPIPAKRSPKLDHPNGDLNRDHNRNKKESSPKANEKRYSVETNAMDTVYENESLEAMIPPLSQQNSITPNAPPLTDSARESLERGGQIVI